MGQWVNGSMSRCHQHISTHTNTQTSKPLQATVEECIHQSIKWMTKFQMVPSLPATRVLLFPFVAHHCLLLSQNFKISQRILCRCVGICALHTMLAETVSGVATKILQRSDQILRSDENNFVDGTTERSESHVKQRAKISKFPNFVPFNSLSVWDSVEIVFEISQSLKVFSPDEFRKTK